MDYELPTHYSDVITLQKNSEIQVTTQHYENKKNAVINNYNDKKKVILGKAFGDYFAFFVPFKTVKQAILWGCGIGLIGGILLYFFILSQLGGWYMIFVGIFAGIFAGLALVFLALPLYGSILLCVLCPILYPIYLLICSNVNKSREKHNLKMEEEMAIEVTKIDNELEKAISQIESSYDKKATDYTSKFELEAQNLSVKYSTSTLAKDVITWISNHYYKLIKAENRESHVQFLETPLEFSVYKDKIACNGLGYYDFEKHRCSNLPNTLSQAALARAIASQVQLSVTMQLEKDPSGTSYKIDIEYNYTYDKSYSYHLEKYVGDEYVTAIITYKATNGNYKPVEEW